MLDGILHLVFLYNRRYYPGTPKWVSREFYSLPRLAGEIGPRLEACQVMAKVADCRPIIEGIFAALAAEHNRMKITGEVKLAQPEFRSQLASVSTQNMVKALEDSLPDELRRLEIRGACDQWVANEDVLIWAEHYTKFKDVFRKKSHIKRNGIGDMII